MKNKPLKILITGGPTRAYIDDVRYLSNYSSGSLAFEICKKLKQSQHEVTAVIGPTCFPFSKLGLKGLHSVMTSTEMHSKVLRLCGSLKPDLVIFSAAVLDFVPTRKQSGKVSSKKNNWVIRLKPAPKTIDEVRKKFPKIRRIGFKLEFEKPSLGIEKWGKSHLQQRKLDALVLNYLSEINQTSHLAFYFCKGSEMKVCRTKRSIAAQISKSLEQIMQSM